MLHLCAYRSAVTGSTIREQVAAVEDGWLQDQDRAFVFQREFKLYTWFAFTADLSFRRFRLESSHWRKHGNPWFIPCQSRILTSQIASINPEIPDYTQLNLPKNDPVFCFIDNTSGSAGSPTVGLWFGDGNKSIASGECFTARFTCSVACQAGIWSKGILTPEDNLPAGRYQVIGMYAHSAALTGILARLIFQNQGNYPGVYIGINNNVLMPTYWRYGHYGVWGEFTETQIPIVEILSTTTGTEAPLIDLDLIKIR